MPIKIVRFQPDSKTRIRTGSKNQGNGKYEEVLATPQGKAEVVSFITVYKLLRPSPVTI